jgi:hypothetical protein
VTTLDHNQTRAEPAVRLRSGRGERRPQTARAARTNDPLALPEALRGRGQSPEGRRWRDLAAHFAARLGKERMQSEATRARVRNLIWLTVELERLHDACVCDRPPVHTWLHMSQEQRVLLTELGLSESTRSNGDDLRDHLRNNSDEIVP